MQYQSWGKRKIILKKYNLSMQSDGHGLQKDLECRVRCPQVLHLRIKYFL